MSDLPPSQASPAAIERYDGPEREAASRRWTDLSDETLRVQALRALRDLDRDALHSLHEAYLTHEGARGLHTSPNTLRVYRQGVRELLEYASEGRFQLLRATPRAMQGLIAAQSARGLKPATIQVRLAAWRSFWAALRWSGAVDSDPLRDTRTPVDRTPGLVKNPPYREDEVKAALAQADASEAALLLLCAHGGLRIQEAIDLRLSDLELKAGRARVQGKGGKTRIVALSGRCVQAVQNESSRAVIRDRRREHVLPYASRQAAEYHLKTLFERAGLPWRGFHAARKHAGTKLLASVGDFGRVAAHLGHASVDTTRKGYAQLSADDLKDVVSQW